MPCFGDPSNCPEDARYILMKPNDAVEYYEAWKNVNKRWSRLTYGTDAGVVLQAINIDTPVVGSKTYAREGHFYFAQQVTNSKHRLTLKGMRGSTIFVNNGITDPLNTNQKAIFVSDGYDDLTIEDIEFDGQDTVEIHCLRILNAERVNLKRLYVHNFLGTNGVKGGAGILFENNVRESSLETIIGRNIGMDLVDLRNCDWIDVDYVYGENIAITDSWGGVLMIWATRHVTGSNIQQDNSEQETLRGGIRVFCDDVGDVEDINLDNVTLKKCGVGGGPAYRIDLLGAGAQRIIKKVHLENFTLDGGGGISADATDANAYNMYDIKVSQGHVKMLGTLQDYGLKAYKLTDIEVMKVKIEDSYFDGFLFIGARSPIVIGNKALNCGTSELFGSSGFRLLGASPTHTRDGIIVGNIAEGVHQDYGIVEGEDSDYNIYDDNQILSYRIGAILLTGVHSRDESNRGYNPLGRIANPYPVAAGYIIDRAAAQAFPTTHVTYTIAHSPKLITIYGGTVTQILIDGVVCGLTSGSFQLNPGQTIHVDWTVQPSSEVYAQ